MNKDAAVFVPSWLVKKPAGAATAAPAPAPAPATQPAQPPAAVPAAKQSPSAAPAAPSKLPFKTPTAAPQKRVDPVPPTLPSMVAASPALPGLDGGAAGAPSAPAPAAGQWKGGATTIATMRPVEQAKERAASSDLNAGAHVFIPRALAKSIAASPPPVHGAAAEFNDTWTLFYIDRPASGMEAFDPAIVYEISSIETFWRTFNNIPTVTHLEPGSNFMLFRKGVEPKWEDEANRNGGAWQLRFQTARDKDDTVDAVWDRLCAAAVGEAWGISVRASVVGVVAKRREKYIVIQVWVTEKIDTFPREFLGAVQEVYPTFQTEYFSHQAVAEYTHAKEEAFQGKQKPKKPKRH